MAGSGDQSAAPGAVESDEVDGVLTDADGSRERRRRGEHGPRGSVHPIAARVGARIRQRRGELGLTQGELGRQVGLSHQQIQKYEQGLARLGCTTLWDIAQVLDVDTFDYFFVDARSPSTSTEMPSSRQPAARAARLGAHLPGLPAGSFDAMVGLAAACARGGRDPETGA
jgi:transcriptional regulator with XRE-family HTH domain